MIFFMITGYLFTSKLIADEGKTVRGIKGVYEGRTHAVAESLERCCTSPWLIWNLVAALQLHRR